ncbi:NYN domain-containing protein [Belnapia sp. T18]|uniref:NYN domain-containing protein n=1 Tax=Belnapia arida TaxID=2804533 RepID=A0ABS1UFA6_9PROT|nr:NYN domain-containing protein [Belnapia arida]MBL6082674.1 NYN domain-containing protein [Belnapia arida]
MSLRPNLPTTVIIDGPHAYMAARTLGFEIDFRRLRDWLDRTCQPRHLLYYTTVLDTPEGDRNPLAPLVNWLVYNGYRVETKPVREFVDEETGRRRIRGNTVAELTVALLEATQWASQVLLLGGDGDLKAGVEAAQRRGVRVVLTSTVKSSPPLCSDELRRAADAFIDLGDLAGEIGKDGGQGRTKPGGSGGARGKSGGGDAV